MHSLDLIGSAEACRILGVSAASVSRWTQTGYLPFESKAPAGRSVRYTYRRADVDVLAARRADAKRALDWSAAS